jgi:predicted secreted protein
MTALAGRLIVVSRGGTPVAGVRVKGLAVAGSSINITTDDDAGWQALLSVVGELAVTITVSGIKLDDTLLNASLTPTGRTAAMTFEYGDSSPPRQVSGDFFLANYNEGAEYQGAGTFDAEFQSNGAVSGTA